YCHPSCALLPSAAHPRAPPSFPTRRSSDLCIAGPLLVAGIAITSAAVQGSAAHVEPAAPPRFKAIAFDYFVLFTPDSVVPEVERVFPGRGRELTNRWRTRQFEYSWLRSITDRYLDFFAVTDDALV